VGLYIYSTKALRPPLLSRCATTDEVILCLLISGFSEIGDFVLNTHYKALQQGTATTHCNNALQQRTATKHCNNTLQQHTATTHCNNALQQRTATTHCNNALQHTYTENHSQQRTRARASKTHQRHF